MKKITSFSLAGLFSGTVLIFCEFLISYFYVSSQKPRSFSCRIRPLGLMLVFLSQETLCWTKRFVYWSKHLPMYFWFTLNQLCPTQMAYWAKKYVTILTRAAHWIILLRAAHEMAYFDLSKLNLA